MDEDQTTNPVPPTVPEGDEGGAPAPEPTPPAPAPEEGGEGGAEPTPPAPEGGEPTPGV